MGIRLFHYYFKDSDKKVTIECADREEARQWLHSIMSEHSEYFQDHPLVNEKMETPVSGVTEKTQGGNQYIWYSNGRSEGWLLKSDYEQFISRDK